MNITWIFKTFDELNSTELYDIIALRQEVFVVEQNCPYQDADGKDKFSYHLLGYDEAMSPAAYSRIVLPGVSYQEISIGRVVTSKKYRSTGLGKILMKETLDKIQKHFGNIAIRISAQSYLVPFYSIYGFETTGKQYLEDNIPHTEMLKS